MKSVIFPLFLALTLTLPLSVLAAEVHGVRLPDSAVVEGRRLVLNGVGVRSKTILRIKVYVAGLYLETKSQDPQQILASDTVRRLELHMTHNASSARIKDEFLVGMRENSADGLASVGSRLQGCFKGMPDIAEGQMLSVTYVPGKGTTLMTHGWQVTVPGKDVADAILRAWLGGAPLDQDLKGRLLGTK